LDLFIPAKMTTPVNGGTNKFMVKDRGLSVDKNYYSEGFQQQGTLKNNHYRAGNNQLGKVINI